MALLTDEERPLASSSRAGAAMYGRIAWYTHIAAYLLIAGVIAKLAIDMLRNQDDASSRDVTSMIRLIGDKQAIIRAHQISIGKVQLQSEKIVVSAYGFDKALLLFDAEQQLSVVDEKRIRFTWKLPIDEEWMIRRSFIDDHCALLVTRDPNGAIYRCLDLQDGHLLWSSRVDCVDRTGPAVRRTDAVDGYEVSCPGWIVAIGPNRSVEPSADAMIVQSVMPMMRLSLRDRKLHASGALLTQVPQDRYSNMIVDVSNTGLAASWVDDQLISSGAPGSDTIVGFQRAADSDATWLTEPGYTLRSDFVFSPSCGHGKIGPMVAPLWLAASSNSSVGRMVLVERGLSPKIAWRSNDIEQSAVVMLGCRDEMQWMRVRVKTGQDVLWAIHAIAGTTVAAFEISAGGVKIPLVDIDLSQLQSSGVTVAVRGRIVDLAWRKGAGNVIPASRRGLQAIDAVPLLTETLGPLP
jgi:hypothetical protein